MQKVKNTLRMVSTRVIFVFAAFAAMVFVSFIFMSDIERKHLLRDVNNAIDNTQAYIEADLMEPETTLGIIAETIRIMILDGDNYDMITKYITDTTNYALANARLMSYVTSIYGVFDVFDGKFHAGIGWTPPDDFVPEDRPWYKMAIAARGRIGVTEPYHNYMHDGICITFTRRIFDEESHPLGVICVDVTLDRIRRYAVDTYVTKGSYGILVDKQFNVLAHPQPSYLGRAIRDMNDGVAIEKDLRDGKRIFERKATDYNGRPSVLFIRQLRNGWYMAVLAYAKGYYQSVTNIGIILSILGLGMALALNIVLLRIAAAKQKADAENRQKSSFLATISHEIRTPMNAILGIAEIQIQNKSLPQETNEALTKIYNSGYSLLGIINDILDLSKIEAGRLELVPVKYELASLIYDTTQLNMMRIGSRMLKFTLHVDPFIPAELIGDELRIKQILNNLLSNAFKYTESGEVSLSISAQYEDMVEDASIMLVLQVRDTGQGMSAEQVKNIFDEYSHFNLEANRMKESTGLGMSITKRLVDMMNGSILVESQLGKGTTFTVSLPQMNAGAVPLGKDTAENLQQFRFNGSSQMKSAQIVRDPMPYGRVLVVDDVETNLYVAKGLLAPYDLAIELVGSGPEAIEKIKLGKVYDIVFMDHMMPEMDGIEATKIIRELGYTNPIIALTANAVAGQAEIFLSSGFDDFVSKPIDIRQLNALLNKLIRDKQPPEVVKAAQKSAMTRRAGDDKAAEAIPQAVDPELAGIFVRDAERVSKTLETIHKKSDAFKDEDIQLFTINIHGIKNALANVHEMDLAEFARKLEKAGRERNVALIATETPVFLEELQAVVEKITPKEENDGDQTIDGDQAFLQEKLLIFRAACVVYDKKAAKDVMSDLKQRSWPRQTKEMLNNLSELLLHSDFEEAANIARDYNSGS